METNGLKLTYNVDMVFCIDTTGSMGSLLEMVKSNALNFYDDVTRKMSEKGKVINQLRIRIISFRDYLADHENAMLVTDFFNLPVQNSDFEQCVRGLIPMGGGDEPEDGLEALAYAIRSDWDTQGMKRRQVIVVWTDASTHSIGFGKSDPNYPDNMASNFEELTQWWGDIQNQGYMSQSGKRLLLFAPEAEYWNTIADNWNQVIHFPSKAGKGMEEIDYDLILNTIVNSI